MNVTAQGWKAVHKDKKAMDRRVQGNGEHFHHLPHSTLEDIVYFSLHTPSVNLVPYQFHSHGGPLVPNVLTSTACGASNAAQTSCNALATPLLPSRFSSLGHTTPQHYLPAQFQDRVLVAAAGPTADSEMHHVTQALTEMWGFPVLCLCITDTNAVCTTVCMTPSLTPTGVTLAHLALHSYTHAGLPL